MKIPKKDIWSRKEFLKARQRQYEWALKDWKDRGSPSSEILIKPPEEIICDTCNDEIETENIFLVNFGRMAVCETCYLKYWDDEKQTYKRV